MAYSSSTFSASTLLSVTSPRPAVSPVFRFRSTTVLSMVALPFSWFTAKEKCEE